MYLPIPPAILPSCETAYGDTLTGLQGSAPEDRSD